MMYVIVFQNISRWCQCFSVAAVNNHTAVANVMNFTSAYTVVITFDDHCVSGYVLNRTKRNCPRINAFPNRYRNRFFQTSADFFTHGVPCPDNRGKRRFFRSGVAVAAVRRNVKNHFYPFAPVIISQIRPKCFAMVSQTASLVSKPLSSRTIVKKPLFAYSS